MVRNLFTCSPFDPYNGKSCGRKVRLDIKDISDHKDSLRVRENKKTGRLEAEDTNKNRSKDELWRDALLSAVTPLEKVSIELSKGNQIGALVHVPDLVDGFLNIRKTKAQISNEPMHVERCLVTNEQIQLMGAKPPTWILNLCEEYILSSYRSTLELGHFAAAFGKISMSSPLNGNVKNALLL